MSIDSTVLFTALLLTTTGRFSPREGGREGGGREGGREEGGREGGREEGGREGGRREREGEREGE